MTFRKKWLLVVLGCVITSLNANAGAPVCHVYQPLPYCSYKGTVSRAYINNSNMVLLYFDTPMDPAAPSSVGIDGITKFNAAIVLLNDNVDFGKMIYASLLAAQARGAEISIQMRHQHGGYLKIDRIWVYD